MPTARTVIVALCALLLLGCGFDSVAPPAAQTGRPALDTPQAAPTTAASPQPQAPPRPEAEPPAGAAQQPVEPQLSPIATGLEVPWGVAFLPDGTAVVTERDSGRVLTVDAAGTVTEVQRLPAVPGGEGGLLGVAVSPTYADDGWVYAYFSTNSDNRVVRFRLGEPATPILTGIPRSSIHNGGRIAFGPDRLLYVATGDADDPSQAQDPGALGGKILRLTSDGAPAPGNPTPGSPVYSLGHRNVQGLAWDAAGRLFASEFGARTADEVNLVEAGGNYGWPHVEGTGGAPQYRDPIIVFATDEASPSGAVILNGGAIPQWEGDLFLGALRGQRVWRLDLNGAAVAGTEPLLVGEYGRIRSVVQAPDGSLWLTSSNRDGRGDPRQGDDRILRWGPPR